MAKETLAHKKYMERYNHEKYREKLIESGMVADPPDDQRPDWAIFYRRLYRRLGLKEYLPALLNNLEEAR
jgi:hypothetical protein